MPDVAPMEDHNKRMAEIREKHDEMQLRTFTRWWNSVLSRRKMKVEDLCEDVKTGVLPINLYECLSGALVKRYVAEPKTRFAMMENNATFISQLKAKGMRLVNIAAEDVTDGNRKLLLGLTWTLILRYEIQKYGDDEQELLRWVRDSTKGYSGVEITSWSDSFVSGLAFGALINKHEPSVLDYDSLSQGSSLSNLESVFSAAEAKLGVPRLIEPAELADNPYADDRSVITYVAKLRQVRRVP